MKKFNLFRTFGIIMFLGILIFILYAFQHPEKGTVISASIFVMFIVLTLIMFSLSYYFSNKNK